MADNNMPEEKEVRESKNFIENIIEKDIADGVYDRPIKTRFPPEPNLRFDDTNPVKEDTEYVDSIMEDVKWLGFEWDELRLASDYFDTMYECAVKLIKKGKAFVCDLTGDEMKEYRGTLTEPGKESPYRDRSVEENL